MLLSQLSKISTYKHLNQKASKTPCIVEFPKIIVIIFFTLKKGCEKLICDFFLSKWYKWKNTQINFFCHNFIVEHNYFFPQICCIENYNFIIFFRCERGRRTHQYPNSTGRSPKYAKFGKSWSWTGPFFTGNCRSPSRRDQRSNHGAHGLREWLHETRNACSRPWQWGFDLGLRWVL